MKFSSIFILPTLSLFIIMCINYTLAASTSRTFSDPTLTDNSAGKNPPVKSESSQSQLRLLQDVDPEDESGSQPRPKRYFGTGGFNGGWGGGFNGGGWGGGFNGGGWGGGFNGGGWGGGFNGGNWGGNGYYGHHHRHHHHIW